MSLSGWSEFYWIRILSRYFSTVVRPVLFWALGLIQRMRLKGKITLWKTQDSKREKVNSWLKMTEKGLTQKSSQISSPDDWTIHIHEIFPPHHHFSTALLLFKFVAVDDDEEKESLYLLRFLRATMTSSSIVRRRWFKMPTAKPWFSYDGDAKSYDNRVQSCNCWVVVIVEL
jgi:hypothetical protein